MGTVGYTRVSTLDQNLHSQTDTLTAAGATKIFTDKITGKNTARPGLAECMTYLRDNEGDVLLVYSTDRLGRSMTDLVSIVGELHRRGVQFRSACGRSNRSKSALESAFARARNRVR